VRLVVGLRPGVFRAPSRAVPATRGRMPFRGTSAPRLAVGLRHGVLGCAPCGLACVVAVGPVGAFWTARPVVPPAGWVWDRSVSPGFRVSAVGLRPAFPGRRTWRFAHTAALLASPLAGGPAVRRLPGSVAAPPAVWVCDRLAPSKFRAFAVGLRPRVSWAARLAGATAGWARAWPASPDSAPRGRPARSVCGPASLRLPACRAADAIERRPAASPKPPPRPGVLPREYV